MTAHEHPNNDEMERADWKRDAGPDLAPLDSDVELRALSALADERVVHGLLRMLAQPDRSAMDHRVIGAVASLSDVEASRPRAPFADGRVRSGQAPDPLGARTRARRLAALAARVLPVVALVVVAALLIRVSTQTPTAVADPLERVVSDHVRAGDKAGPRRYSILIERDTPQGLLPMRGTVDIAPAPARKEDGSPLRGGRFLVRLGGERGPRVAFGFDGESFWYVPDDGPVRVGPSKRVIEDANQLRGLVAWLVVERALRQLQPDREGSGPLFDISIEELDGGLRRHTLRRSAALPPDAPWPAFRPTEVVLEAAASDRVVRILDAYWPDGAAGRTRHPARIKHLRFELLMDQAPPPEWDWFSHSRHHDPAREIMIVPEEPEDGTGDAPPRRPILDRLR